MNHSALVLDARLLALLVTAVTVTTPSAASACVERVVARAAGYTYLATRYDSLDALEHAVRRNPPDTLGFELCSEASARTFKATVHRFRDLPQAFFLPEPAAKSCATGTGTEPPEASARNIDDRTVELYWRRTMP